MPTVPDLHKLLYFWCYELIRAGLDLYTFDWRMLIQHVQEEGIESFHLRINVVKDVYHVPRNKREIFAKVVGDVPGITSCSDVFGLDFRATYPQCNLN